MTRDHRVKGWISPLDKTNAIDYLTFQHEELSSNNPKEFKKLYKASRPNFLEQFGGLYDKRLVAQRIQSQNQATDLLSPASRTAPAVD